MPISVRGLLPVLAPVAPVSAFQAKTVEECVREVYDLHPEMNAPFYARLQRDHPELCAQITAKKVKAYVTKWRQGIRNSQM